MDSEGTVYKRMCMRCGKVFNTRAKSMEVVCDDCNLRFKIKPKSKTKYVSNEVK